MQKHLEAYWKQLAYQKYDLTNCESEPLQFCGAIQDCGYFIGCEKNGEKIIAVSMNANELNIDPSKSLGQNFGSLFKFADGSHFEVTTAIRLSKAGPVLIKPNGSETTYVASISENKTLTCIDIEPYNQASETFAGGRGVHDPVLDLKQLVHLLDEAKTIEDITQQAAEQIQIITGFQRVMIYRFQANWDGQVIAEAIQGDYPPYLDLHYPASDIPAQARKLYYESKYRMIVDTDALPIPIATHAGLGKSEIDLSCSSFRASSPIHIQYLKNMGVRTSFSLPIKVNGELWGLVSCHGYGDAIKLTRLQRAACELASQVISGRIADAVSERRLRIRNSVYELTQQLLTKISEGATAISAFRQDSEAMLNLTSSGGAYIRISGDELYLGQCPPKQFIDQVTEKLASKVSLSVFESQSLEKDLSVPFQAEAIGGLAIPLSLGFTDLIIWFRPEHVYEVKWGGKPNEQEKLVNSLEPRTSFAAWTETVRHQSRAWTESDIETAQYVLFTFIRGIFKKAADLSKSNQELEKATRAKDEFIGMVSHELRTPLGVIIGWIDVMKDFQFREPLVNKALETIDRNARVQINLINDLLDVSRIISGKMRINPESNVDFSQIARDAVDTLLPTANSKGVKLICDVTSKHLISGDPERLRQIIWNLVTNAIKFTPKGGHVIVDIQSRSSMVDLSVTDNGIGIPANRIGSIFNRFEQIGEDGSRTGGLGLGLSIVKSLVELHGGRIGAKSNGEGAGSTFTVNLPVYALIEEFIPNTTATLKSDASALLTGLRILLAEDQPDSAQAMGHMLRRQGADVVIVGDGQEAFEELKNGQFDLLLSDIGMPKWDGYRLISEWRNLERERQAQPIPALALTAYATSQDRTNTLKAGFQNHIPKPLDKNELLAVIQSLNIKK